MKLKNQSGVILLLIVLAILGLGAGMLLLTINTANVERSQRKAVSGVQALIAAKEALIGYAIGPLSASGARPGWLPLPDTLSNTNYDGKSETASCLDGGATNGLPALSGVASKVANLRCLGRLPWNTLGLPIDGASEQDLLGLVPWYAVSPNLADPNPSNECMTVLNPTTAALTPTTFTCPTSTGPAWPWLKVCDNTGKIISDRVAVVLILPGEAVATTGRTQQRVKTVTGTNPNGYGYAGDFLDAVPTPAGWSALPVAQRCTTFDNAAMSGEFIIGDISSSFNDQLVYITVDEIMLEAEKRAALEMSEALNTVKTAYSSYPWLTPITIPSLTTTTYLSTAGTNAGLIPFHDYTNASNRFQTELSWNIGGLATGDIGTFTGNLTTAETQFNCGGGVNPVCNCRIRLATSATAIPRTLDATQWTTIKSGTPSFTTPLATCQRSTSASKSVRDNTLSCDTPLTITTTTPVTYAVQRRNTSGGNCLTGGTRVNIGNFSGVTTRTISLTIAGFTGTASTQAGSATTHASRTITNASYPSTSMIDVTDKWVPDTLGVAPFDQFAATYPTGITTGAGTTSQTTSVTLSKIRVYPDMPSWYASQKWHEFMYSMFSPDVVPAGAGANCTTNCLTAGTRTNIDSVTISSGAALAGQSRYSGTPAAADFLEAPNATGSTTRTFAAPTQNRTSTYADSVITQPR
jgi:hypothetical protein